MKKILLTIFILLFFSCGKQYVIKEKILLNSEYKYGIKTDYNAFRAFQYYYKIKYYKQWQLETEKGKYYIKYSDETHEDIDNKTHINQWSMFFEIVSWRKLRSHEIEVSEIEYYKHLED